MIPHAEHHGVAGDLFVGTDAHRVACWQHHWLERAECSLRVGGAYLSTQLTLLNARVRTDEESATFPIGHDLEGDRAATWLARVQGERPAHIFGRADEGSIGARCDDLQELLRGCADQTSIPPEQNAHQTGLSGCFASGAGSVSVHCRLSTTRSASWAKSASTRSRSSLRHCLHRWPLTASPNRTTARVSRPR